MRNTKTKCKTWTRTLTKCKKRFIAYNPVQYKYAERLEADNDVVEIKPNFKLKDFELGDNWTSDFVVVKSNNEYAVIETIVKKHILFPSTIKKLDLVRKYWAQRGVTDFRLVVGI